MFHNDKNDPVVLVYQHIRGMHGITASLREIGLCTTVIQDGRQFIVLAKQRPVPAMILLDTKMEGMDGLAVCRTLKANAMCSSIPMLFLSEVNDPFARVQALEAGAAEYMAASCELREIMLRVRMHMELPNQQCASATTQAQVLDYVNSNDQDLVWAAQAYIADHLYSGLTPRELARKMGATESGLNLAFRTLLGSSVAEYLRLSRLRAAASMLQEQTLRISEIAELLGYSDAANFATAFRCFSGHAPSRYRIISRQHEGAAEQRYAA